LAKVCAIKNALEGPGATAIKKLAPKNDSRNSGLIIGTKIKS